MNQSQVVELKEVVPPIYWEKLTYDERMLLGQKFTLAVSKGNINARKFNSEEGKPAKYEILVNMFKYTE